MVDFESTFFATQTHLEQMCGVDGYWEGELASSALSTATAIVALMKVDSEIYFSVVDRGADWLIRYQNEDGGWGDTTISESNLSTTLLVWSCLHLVSKHLACRCTQVLGHGAMSSLHQAIRRSHSWLMQELGSIEPARIQEAVADRYGKDRTFSVPILMLCAICGTLGRKGWQYVLSLPFELAILPRQWFGAIGLPVVSYALPALIAIGHARHVNAPLKSWHPLRWLRQFAWPRVSSLLTSLQPASGGYLEATPLTSFVVMALAASGEKNHTCIDPALRFLLSSQRRDGSWPIDSNLATWGTTLSVKALGSRLLEQKDGVSARQIEHWLTAQQYQQVHPFTLAKPGGWGWSHLSGAVPDADDTAGALVALYQLQGEAEPNQNLRRIAAAGVSWLLDLQNRDGGIPTFCRGWGTLPFDRSTADLTGHALWAWALWRPYLDLNLQRRVNQAVTRALKFLQVQQTVEGAWIPLWFGNEKARQKQNPVYGTAIVLRGLHFYPQAQFMVKKAVAYLLSQQDASGGWGGEAGVCATLEETGVTLTALLEVNRNQSISDFARLNQAIETGVSWLVEATRQGTYFPSAPLGLYFAQLWYHERLYPIVWTLSALRLWKEQYGENTIQSSVLESSLSN